MINEFLHKIDVDQLKSELNMDVPEIAKLAGISENGVYKWAWSKDKNGTRPSFNAVVRLLEKGASTKTLFGVDSASAFDRSKRSPLDLIGDEDFQKGIQKSIEAKIDSVMDARVEHILRAKGVIR